MKYRAKCIGFSLIEILVSFSIAAVALAIIFQIYSRGSQSARLSQEYTEAIAIAESKLDELNTVMDMQQPQRSGIERNKYGWTVRVDAYRDAANEINAGIFTLKAVEVEVMWVTSGKQYRIALQSLKPHALL